MVTMVGTRGNFKAIVYAATTFGSKVISSVFNFYYVKIFLDRYHMNQAWFQLSQLIFAVWNAVNDPWFGYLQDTRTTSWLALRRKCILYGALPWVISFLIPWFPWADYSSESNGFICFLQGLTALCMFDMFFTFCLLAHCGLMTEYGETEAERLTMVTYMGVAGILGSSSVFFTNYFSVGLTNYGMFQLLCVAQALIALGLFCFTGYYAETKYDLQPTRDPPKGSYWSLTKEIFKNKNFVLFVSMNFMQELHISYIMSFAKIFSEQMVPENALSNSTRSLLLGALMVLPQVFVILAGPVISRYGLYRIVTITFYIKVTLGIVMFLSGQANTIWFMIFLVVDFVLADGPFSYFSVHLSDIADEDMTLHSRSKPISSMIFGSNALVVKPALSLSPMFVAALLDKCGYEAIKAGTATPEDKAYLQKSIFLFACLAPVIVGLLQILVWRHYKLHKGFTPEKLVAEH